MSNEVILNLSFNNQTVTDLTGNWTLDGTPNATYEQIEGRNGYSIVTGSLGRCIVLNAVDQNTIYNEYTVDFDMFVKSTYTSDYYIYTIIYMWSLINPGTEYSGEIGNVLDICLEIGGSERAGTTNYSPIGRWVHVTLTSGPTEVDYQYCTTAYVDGVKLIDRTDIDSRHNPFALSQQILLLTRDTDAKLMPNGPGICLNTFKVVTGIHMPNQNPAISLFNLSRVFNNFCTWLKRQLSTVAFTGSYNDLSNKPTISTVNDGTLTIQQNGTNVQTFTANASTNKTANIQCVDLSTAQTIGGVKTFTSNMVIQGSKKVTCNLDNSFIELDGGTTWGKGGSIVLSGQDRSSYTNSVLIVSKSDTNTDILQYQNGELKPHQNNTNNSSLGTSTNKWAKVYSDDVVHTTGDETISGVKKFSDGLFVSKSGQGDLATLEDSSINSTNEDANGMPLTGHTNSVKIKGSQSNVVPCMLIGQLHTNGNTVAELRAYKYKDLTASAILSLRYNYNGNYGTATFDNISAIIPGITNTTNLGTSALQWNKIYTRNILIDNDISIANSLINKTSNSGMLSIRSGLTNQDGASIALYSKDYSGGSSYVGNIYMTAYGNSDYTIFRIYPNGTMSVYNNSAATTKIVAMQENVVPRSGGAVMTDYFLGRSVNTESLMISGGTSWSSGGSLETFGSGHSSNAGRVRLQPALSDSNFKTMNLEPSGTWSWSGTACQITSDQRFKQQIAEIDDKLLDAWEDVDLVQFKYNDAVDQKKDKARLHTGYVVQQIDSACKSHGVDISEYGLYCHEEYPEETEEVEVEQEDGTKVKERKVIREASEHYSLRYTETLIVECAYLRKKLKELTARIEQLEKGNNSK